MLETGQPLLVYDYDKLQSKEIIIRSALEKEKISVANEKKLNLSSEDTVISTKKEIHPTKGKAKIINWRRMTTKKITPRIISIDLEFIEKKLGLKLNPADLEKIFKRLDFSFKKRAKNRLFGE